MTLEVLARKMRITVREAEQQLAARGLILDGKGTRFFDPGIADQAKRNRESDEREQLKDVVTYEELGDLKARVLRMAEDSRPPNKIAKSLTIWMQRNGEPAVTYQQVQKILKEAREAVEA
jgi:DNA-binding GntR family transcriptional regulator